jgi:hypothetical protein
MIFKASPDQEDVMYQHVPMSLMATPYPLKHYKHALELDPAMGKLVAGIVRDPSMINKTLDSFSKQDDFIARLLDVSKAFNECDASVPR